MMQPQPGYPAAPYAGAQSPASTDGIAGAAKAVVALAGARAALPVIFYVVPLGRLLPPQLAHSAIDGLKGLVGLAALIAYFVWFSRFYSWVRAARGGTKYSNGLAIGGWFIPFANFVMPYLALRDAARRGANDDGGGLVPLWWLSYLGATFLAVVEAVIIQVQPQTGNVDLMNTIWKGMFWSQFLLQIVTWGLLAHLVTRFSKHAK